MRKQMAAKVCLGMISFVLHIVLVMAVAFGNLFSALGLQGCRGQERIRSVDSPTGRYTVTIYRNNGGATTDYAVLGRLTDNLTREEKNIYWQYHQERAAVKWIDNNTVEIANVVLDVRTEVYDYRYAENSA